MPEIVNTAAAYSCVDVKLETTDKRTFYMRVGREGIEFYGDYQSIWGSTNEIPVTLSADEIFDAIAGKGDKKPFRSRVKVQPKAPVSVSTIQGPISFSGLKNKPTEPVEN